MIATYNSYSSSIEDDFKDLEKNFPLLKKHNLLFLDPAPAKNYDDRKKGAQINMVVVHHTEEPTLTATKDVLNSRGISVHFVVDRDGSITLMVPLEKMAWHTGISYAKILDQELDGLNLYSVGIEIVNSGLEPFSEEQMKTVKDLILYLMKRFQIKKDMIFSHSEIGTIIYDKDLDDYTMRKPDPHKLFDWEFLEENGVGLHINNRISPDDAKKEIQEVLYEFGNKSDDILKLKKRLNNFFYKIRPWNDKDGKILFPDNQSLYTDNFDEIFSWVVLQFSMHHLPKEIRENLMLKLEQGDILPDFLRDYGNEISNQFYTFKIEVLNTVKSSLSKKDYESLVLYLKKYNNGVSYDAFYTLMYKMKLYYNCYLRYKTNTGLYQSFKNSVLLTFDNLRKKILSLKSLPTGKAAEISNMMEGFESRLLLNFSDFESEWFQEFKCKWAQEFIPNLEKQMTWTRLHENILEYLEVEKENIF
ncbi:N-acetylmuramoyl-L-alanine amidase domain [Cinara cedri]|uniref:N-acetylmuramoyl-L-alanine amidase n=1 Tax=Cinara cedri TaxID=506608 RepID=A0A5E4ML71_9HEMI|nr:N-acetylmuramoyl-L-alanine amidase domain [Cinara cedri]